MMYKIIYVASNYKQLFNFNAYLWTKFIRKNKRFARHNL